MSFDQDIIQDFLTESGELLEQLDQDLVVLEGTPRDPEMLNRVFRALHTIKGSASFLALTNLVEVAHAAESALNSARAGSVVLNKAAMDLILGAVDVLKRQFDNLRAGEDLVKADEQLVAGLTAIGEGRVPAAAPAAVAAAAQMAAADRSTPALASPQPEIAERNEIAAASAEPAADAPAARPGASAIERLPLRLDESKSSLIEYLVSDLRETIAQAEEALGMFQSPERRSGGAAKLTEIGESMLKSARFFEFEQMEKLAEAIVTVAGEQELNDAMMTQLMPRVHGVFELIREQTDGLAYATLIKRPIDGLCASIRTLLTDGQLDPQHTLECGATPVKALAADGVIIEDRDARPDASAAPMAQPVSAADAEPVATPDQTPLPEPATMAAARPLTESAITPAGNDLASAVIEPVSAQSAGGSTVASAQPAPAGGVAEGGENKGGVQADQTIRVEVGRLEALLNLVGELVLQKNRLSAIARSAQATGVGTHEFHETLGTATGSLDRVTSDIQVAVMRTRMQPLDKLFGRYPRLIRDLARKTGKEIKLAIEGGHTEVDKSVIEELGDPLVHILRNSADHGIEMPEERVKAGKPACGTITLSASHEGSFVQVRIKDDGKGLSRSRIGKKAVERGLVTEQGLAQMSDADVYKFIFAAGFSTAEKVTDLSGRGVGMDVVRTNIEKIKGSVDLASTEGTGTTITIKIPLTVAILTAMMVRIGTETYAVPLASVVEIVKPEGAQLSSIRGSPVMRLRDEVLPLLDGCEVFDLPPSKREESPFAVILSMGDKRVGLMVTKLIGQQEVVIKPLDEMVDRAGPVSGATVRDDGGVSLIVDVARMCRLAEERVMGRPRAETRAHREPALMR